MKGPSIPGFGSAYCIMFWYQIVSPDEVKLKVVTDSDEIVEEIIG